MILAQCPGCLTQSFLDCQCPAGHVTATGTHHESCSLANIDAQVRCGCCAQDHDHGAAADACPGNHAGQPCPEPDTCRAWAGATADTRHPAYEGEPAGPCPGGHCHKDVPGCTVCRPLVITMMPGSADIQFGRLN